MSGKGKYLIESEEQHKTVRRFIKEQQDRDGGIGFTGEDVEERVFVETPSDRYTPFRIIANAAGSVVAAGLIYSSHAKEAIVPPSSSDPYEQASDVAQNYAHSTGLIFGLDCLMDQDLRTYMVRTTHPTLSASPPMRPVTLVEPFINLFFWKTLSRLTPRYDKAERFPL